LPVAVPDRDPGPGSTPPGKLPVTQPTGDGTIISYSVTLGLHYPGVLLRVGLSVSPYNGAPYSGIRRFGLTLHRRST